MKKQLHKSLIATAACAVAMSAGVHAATVAFEYTDPADFLDIRSTDVGQKKFEESVMGELEDQFQKEAAALPADQTLQVTVKDVDLAGDIEYFHRFYPFGLRVVRNVDVPRLEFSYVLRDASGEVLKSGDENISDLGFRSDTLTRRNMEPFDYERNMISEWADETFSN